MFIDMINAQEARVLTKEGIEDRFKQQADELLSRCEKAVRYAGQQGDYYAVINLDISEIDAVKKIVATKLKNLGFNVILRDLNPPFSMTIEWHSILASTH